VSVEVDIDGIPPLSIARAPFILQSAKACSETRRARARRQPCRRLRGGGRKCRCRFV